MSPKRQNQSKRSQSRRLSTLAKRLAKGQSGMSKGTRYERFLDLVYLNENMVLNCAAYLFRGVPTESERTEEKDSGHSASASIAIPLISNILGTPKLEGGIRSSSSEQSRAAYQYTVGGLHMAVLDELNERNMIQAASADGLKAEVGSGETYVDVHGILRPSDCYSLIGTIKIIGPLLSQVIRDFGQYFLPNDRLNAMGVSDIRNSVENYENSIMSLIEKLERDYLTSNQLEMIIWSKSQDGRPVAIVDLDVSNHDPNELREKLSGGKYHVIGKIVGRVGHGESMDLLQKTTLSNSVEIIQKIVSLSKDQDALKKFREQSAPLLELAEKFVRLKIQGPAVRIAAMSVCI